MKKSTKNGNRTPSNRKHLQQKNVEQKHKMKTLQNNNMNAWESFPQNKY